MTRLKSYIDDDKLAGAGVGDLSPDQPLIARQVEALLSRSKSRLESDRRDGKPPPFYLDGRKVLYRLGDVLAERARTQAITPAQAKAAVVARIQHGARTFTAFLAQADLQDTWPIANVRGCPTDFFSTLSMKLDDDDMGEVEDLSLGEFLERRLMFARSQVENK
jgi:hypothetical protein